MNKNSRIFIAGHQGLVGSAVFRLFLKKGYKNIYVATIDIKNKSRIY